MTKTSSHPRFLKLALPLTAALALSIHSGRAIEPAPTGVAESPQWVTGRIAELQPKPEEKRLDEIGWADDIRQALSLAKQHGRPVFLFTHDGRINLGRC